MYSIRRGVVQIWGQTPLCTPYWQTKACSPCYPEPPTSKLLLISQAHWIWTHSIIRVRPTQRYLNDFAGLNKQFDNNNNEIDNQTRSRFYNPNANNVGDRPKRRLILLKIPCTQFTLWIAPAKTTMLFPQEYELLMNGVMKNLVNQKAPENIRDIWLPLFPRLWELNRRDESRVLSLKRMRWARPSWVISAPGMVEGAICSIQSQNLQQI